MLLGQNFGTESWILKALSLGFQLSMSKVENWYVSPLGPQRLVSKVKDQTFITIGLQLLAAKFGDPKSSMFGLQLLVLKVGAHNFLAKEKIHEYKTMF